jgi:hypothetical protein
VQAGPRIPLPIRMEPMTVRTSSVRIYEALEKTSTLCVWISDDASLHSHPHIAPIQARRLPRRKPQQYIHPSIPSPLTIHTGTATTQEEPQQTAYTHPSIPSPLKIHTGMATPQDESHNRPHTLTPVSHPHSQCIQARGLIHPNITSPHPSAPSRHARLGDSPYRNTNRARTFTPFRIPTSQCIAQCIIRTYRSQVRWWSGHGGRKPDSGCRRVRSGGVTGERATDPESREDEGDEPSERSGGKKRPKQVQLSNVLVAEDCLQNGWWLRLKAPTNHCTFFSMPMYRPDTPDQATPRRETQTERVHSPQCRIPTSQYIQTCRLPMEKHKHTT